MSPDLNALKQTLRKEIDLRKQRLKEQDASFSEHLLINRKIYDGKQSLPCNRYHLSRDRVSLATIDPSNSQDFLTPSIFSLPQEALSDAAAKWSRSSERLRSQRQWFLSKMPDIKICPELISTRLDKLLDLYSSNERLEAFSSSSQNQARYLLASLIKSLLNSFLSALNLFPWHCPLVFPHETSSFLAFLEYEALEANNPKPFSTLLLTRTLIYTGLPAKKLFNLKLHPRNMLLLSYDQEVFAIPESFSKICQHFNFSGYLLPEHYRRLSNPEQGLNTKIKRTNQRHGTRLSKNGVKGPYPRMTPTSLRNTLSDLKAMGDYTYTKGILREDLSSHSQKIEESFKNLIKEKGLNRFLGQKIER